MTALLAVFLAIQMPKDCYVPWIYWVVVVFLSVAGNLLTDNLSNTHIQSPPEPESDHPSTINGFRRESAFVTKA
ncbi:MAG: hypothetical protein M3R41_00595 [Pseudomonadota bacterium]|nr:hypothetical protein [Pseudomonadota bacterium]